MVQPQLSHPFARLAQHHLRDIDADDRVARRIVRQRDAGADADLQDSPADLLGGVIAALRPRSNTGPKTMS